MYCVCHVLATVIVLGDPALIRYWRRASTLEPTVVVSDMFGIETVIVTGIVKVDIDAELVVVE